MKKMLFFLVGIFYLQMAAAQLKTTVVCPVFTIDVLDGRINELFISSTMAEYKKVFPCYSSSEEESASAKCGGYIFYTDKDIYCYTGRDYIEIREKFKGKLSLPLLGTQRTGLFKWLGHPKIKDVNWDAFQTAYGILVVYYNKSNKVNKLVMTTKGTETLRLCE